MNHYLTSFIFLIFLLISTSLQSTDIQTLQKDSSITVDSNFGMVYFDSSSFQIGDEIEFEIKATSFNVDKLYYLFQDNNSSTFADLSINENSFYSESYHTKKGEEKDKSFEYKYYKIKKDSAHLNGGLSGKFLVLIFDCEGNDVIIKNGKNLAQIAVGGKPSTGGDGILKKSGSITVNWDDGGIIFDSSDFKVGDEIYIKIKAEYFYDSHIYYEFVDDLSTYEPSYVYEDYYKTFSTKTDYEGDFVIHYYTIKKDNSHLDNQKGNYLIIYFDCDGSVTITNTVENEGNNATVIAVVVVAVIVVIVVLAIVIYCYRRKKMAPMVNGMEVAPQSYGVQNPQNCGNQYNQNNNMNMNFNSNNQMNGYNYNNNGY